MTTKFSVHNPEYASPCTCIHCSPSTLSLSYHHMQSYMDKLPSDAYFQVPLYTGPIESKPMFLSNFSSDYNIEPNLVDSTTTTTPRTTTQEDSFHNFTLNQTQAQNQHSSHSDYPIDNNNQSFCSCPSCRYTTVYSTITGLPLAPTPPPPTPPSLHSSQSTNPSPPQTTHLHFDPNDIHSNKNSTQNNIKTTQQYSNLPSPRYFSDSDGHVNQNIVESF